MICVWQCLCGTNSSTQTLCSKSLSRSGTNSTTGLPRLYFVGGGRCTFIDWPVLAGCVAFIACRSPYWRIRPRTFRCFSTSQIQKQQASLARPTYDPVTWLGLAAFLPVNCLPLFENCYFFFILFIRFLSSYTTLL